MKIYPLYVIKFDNISDNKKVFMYRSVISFVGSSGSGKTTLIEKVIKKLTENGYKVGAIKHDAHRFEIDKPGKDSYRFKEAGALISTISSSEKIAFVKSHENSELNIDEIILRYFSDTDIIITEGYKKSNVPKIEVYRVENHNQPVMFDSPYLVAIATNYDLSYINNKLIELGCKTNPVIFDINDVESIAAFIEKIIEPDNINIDITGIDEERAEIIKKILKSLKFIKFEHIDINITKKSE